MSFLEMQVGDFEKEATDLLDDPNRRPMAWKLNQLGNRGQRK